MQTNTLLTLPNDVYRSHPAVSQSELKEILRSPAHYKYKKEHPTKSTTAMEFGTMFHTLLLEPQNFDVRLLPEGVKKNKDGTVSKKQEGYEDWWADALHEDTYLRLLDMVNAVKAHPETKDIFDYGLPERSVIFDQLGIECKARFDWLRLDKNVIIDVKTTRDARPDKFKKMAYEYGYHIQAYWYLKAYEAVTGKTPHYRMVVIESEPPHGIVFYKADPVFLELGGMDAREMLLKYQKCQETGVYEGYEVIKGGTPLTLPNYIK